MILKSHNGPADAWHIEPALWLRGRNIIAFVLLVSWVASIVGYVLDPHRFFQSYLIGFLLSVAIPIGALFFVMVQFLTGSAWSIPMRRIAENIMITLPLGLVFFVPVALGVHELYHWSHVEAAAKDPVLKLKTGYLNETFFFLRGIAYFAIWGLLANRIYSHSTRQDKTGSLEHMHGASRWSAPGVFFVVVFGSLAAFDWVMSLDPHWYSTIFGVYFLVGAALAFLSTWTLTCLIFRENGILRNTITIEHYHDLGKWMFALTAFWGYIAFSQYMLIWYANLPEETEWFYKRFQGTWQWWSVLIVVGHFIIPFFGLLPRAAKRNLKWLAGAAIWILLMEFVDLYWLVMPEFHKGGFSLHWLDAVAPIAVLSAFAMAFWFRMKAHAIMPIGDPRFEQGLEFENI